jgi:chitinase
MQQLISKSGSVRAILMCLLSVVFALVLVSCGGGSSSSGSSSSTPTTATHTLANANLALSTSDEGHLKTAVNTLHLSPGNSSSIEINAVGSSQAQYLSTLQCQNQTCKDLVTFGLPSGNTIDVNVTIPSTYTAGTYTIPIHASSATNASVISNLTVHVGANSMLKVSYIDITATGSLALITAGGYTASNVLVFAFAPVNTSTINQGYLAAIQAAITNGSQGTVNLLSIGGATGSASAMSDTTTVVRNITAQIAAYNAQLKGGKINGVDLDLEGSFTSEQILALAQGFKTAGLLVSTAPQMYYSIGSNVNPENPTNLVLTSGGSSINANVYGAAIAGGYVDYIMAQTYNTDGWTVGNYNESQPEFFSAISRALNVSVKSSCTGATTLCIPAGTKIAVGQPANAGAGGYTIFNPTAVSPIPSYNQTTILTSLQTQVNTVIQNPATYGNISGVMMWSLNNDYAPQLYTDNYATSGAFSSTIFGAPLPPAIPYFILQITNTGPNNPGPGAYAAATLVVNGSYWIFGNKYNEPITPALFQSWGTKTSATNPATPNVIDSSNLDSIFATGNKSFTASQILIDGYADQTHGLSNPTTPAVVCPQGAGYIFQANKSYNIMINAATGVCDITIVN